MAVQADVAECLLLKHRITQAVRKVLGDHGFVEVNTPTIRGAADAGASRRRVVTDDPYASGSHGFLKHTHDAALRALLQHLPRVFELNPCYRLDHPDGSHYPEFMMLEFAASGEDWPFFIDLSQQIISSVFERPVNYAFISIRESVQTDLGVDIASEDGEAVKQRLISRWPGTYRRFADLPPFHAVNHYIAERLEPRKGLYFLVDYPVCTVSKAKRIPGTHMIQRFEAFANGLELANAYMDEDDEDDYLARSRANGRYNSEVEMTISMLRNGQLPRESGGVGFGLERLCCAYAGRGIEDFIAAKEFGFVAREQ